MMSKSLASLRLPTRTSCRLLLCRACGRRECQFKDGEKPPRLSVKVKTKARGVTIAGLGVPRVGLLLRQRLWPP